MKSAFIPSSYDEIKGTIGTANPGRPFNFQNHADRSYLNTQQKESNPWGDVWNVYAYGCAALVTLFLLAPIFI